MHPQDFLDLPSAPTGGLPVDRHGAASDRARDRPWRGRLLTAVATLLAAAPLAGTAFVLTEHRLRIGGDARLAFLPSPPPSAAAPVTPLPPAAVADLARSRVITVESETDRGERFGTGWLLDDHGDFVTNDHVVQRSREVRLVDRGGNVHAATVVGFDAVQDVAVVRSSDGYGAPPLAVTADISVSQPVVVLGSTRATMHPDVTVETVDRLHQTITVKPEPDDPASAQVEYSDMVVLRGSPVYQGNSGGPVLDDLGRVVGIVTASSQSTPTAYAIPIQRVIDELRAFAARP